MRVARCPCGRHGEDALQRRNGSERHFRHPRRHDAAWAYPEGAGSSLSPPAPSRGWRRLSTHSWPNRPRLRSSGRGALRARRGPARGVAGRGRRRRGFPCGTRRGPAQRDGRHQRRADGGRDRRRRRAAFRAGPGRSGDRRPRAGRRSSLAGRPLRAGFVMAVAGCALGGAAVAAGAGVLPTPFGGGGAPAASVSPLASPSGDRERRRRAAAACRTRPAAQDAASREGGGPGRPIRRAAMTSRAPSGDATARTRTTAGARTARACPADKKAIARALCVAYEDTIFPCTTAGSWSRSAGGPEDVEKFCDKYDGGTTRSRAARETRGASAPRELRRRRRPAAGR